MTTKFNRLPLIHDPKYGPCFLIDNSTLEMLITCPRFFEYSRVIQRIPVDSKPSLNFGGAIHVGLEHRYKLWHNRAPDPTFLSSATDLLTKHFTTTPQPEDDYRTLNWAIQILARYNEIYADEPFQLLFSDKACTLPMVELSFAVPLFTTKMPDGTPITFIYIGRIDLPTRWDGNIFIGDHKTTSFLGDMFFNRMKMSAQQKGYCWAFHECTGIEVRGYFINAIRVKEPPKKIQGNGPETAKWWSESFCRQRFYLNPGELDEWKSNTIALCEELLWHAGRDYFPMKTAWCNQFGRCPYFDVCSMQKIDRGVMLASGLYTKNTWTPLHVPSEAVNS